MILSRQMLKMSRQTSELLLYLAVPLACRSDAALWQPKEEIDRAHFFQHECYEKTLNRQPLADHPLISETEIIREKESGRMYETHHCQITFGIKTLIQGFNLEKYPANAKQVHLLRKIRYCILNSPFSVFMH